MALDVPHRVAGDLVVPRYLGEPDHPWLAALIETYQACVGAERRILDARLRHEATGRVPAAARHVASRVLDGEFPTTVEAVVKPAAARAALFHAAADRAPRAAVVEAVARDLGVTADQLLHALLADVPGERRVTAPATPPSPTRIAALANLRIVQTLLRRSLRATIQLQGNALAVVRLARLRGLICTVSAPGGIRPVELAVSGPLALFRHTTLYGRALAELVPTLCWARDFELRADCIVGSEPKVLVLRPHDPLPAGREPAAYHSAVERRFARDFMRAAPDWRIVREPQPVAVGSGLIFPDFLLCHPDDPARRWLLEIAGFWTPEYVERKLATLRAAAIPNLILCLDAQRACGAETLPEHGHVLRYQRRIDVDAVLRVLAGE